MRHFILILLAVALTACGSSDSFTVSVEMENLGLEALRMTYVSSGRVLTAEGRAKEPGDAVELTGESEVYTLVRLMRADGSHLATFPARNGEHVRIKLDGDGGLESMTGNTPCDSLSAFLSRTAKLDPAAMDNAIARYVRENPASVASTVLLVSRFDAAANPEMADSLFAMLTPEVKSRGIVEGWSEQLSLASLEQLERRIAPMTLYGTGDSTVTFAVTTSPYTLLAFTPMHRPDSIAAKLRTLRADRPRKRLNIIEITLNADSAAWNQAVARDSATWRRAWVPGGAASPALRRLSISRTPFFILTDSTGRQIYRGPSLTALNGAIQNSINN